LSYAPYVAGGVAGVTLLIGGALTYMTHRMSLLTPRTDLFVKFQTDADLQSRLKGKAALIVGGTKGIGAALALALAKKQVDVVIVGRQDSDNIAAQLKTINPEGNHGFISADLQTVKGMTEAAQTYMKSHDRIDFLILTVGILAPPQRRETTDGLEWDFAVSTFSRYVIIKEMSDFLKKQKKRGDAARVYIMGFPGNDEPKLDTLTDPQSKTTYSSMPAHMKTIVFNEAMVHGLAQSEKDFAVFGLAPGMIATDIRREATGRGFFGNAIEWVIGMTGRSMSGYVAATLPVIADPNLGLDVTGAIFNTYGQPIEPAKRFQTPENVKKHFDYLEQLYSSLVVKKRQ